MSKDIQEIVSKIEKIAEAAKTTRPDRKTLEEFVEHVKQFRKLADETVANEVKLYNERKPKE